MKSTLLRSFLEWALITSVLMSVGFFSWYWIKSHAIRVTNAQMVKAQAKGQAESQNNHAVVGMLLSECQAYARTNADMARLLAPAASGTPVPAVTPKTGGK